MSSVAGADADTAVLICPAWWPQARIGRARQAAHTVATDVVVLERIAMLRQGISADTTVVEVTSDALVVTAFGTIAAVVARGEETVAAIDAVAAAVGAPAGVLVDAPPAVHGAEFLASMIAQRMRAIGVSVRFAGDDEVRHAAALQRSHHEIEGRGGFSNRKALAVLSGVVSAVVLCAGFTVVAGGGSDRPIGEMPMTLLVEGRIAVMVPANWTARRITSGPGSARVQIVSPTDGNVALHITQSDRPAAFRPHDDRGFAAPSIGGCGRRSVRRVQPIRSPGGQRCRHVSRDSSRAPHRVDRIGRWDCPYRDRLPECVRPRRPRARGLRSCDSIRARGVLRAIANEGTERAALTSNFITTRTTEGHR